MPRHDAFRDAGQEPDLRGTIMMVTFHSPATPDVVMLRDLAQYLLGLVGKRLDTRGVISHEDLPHAIARLETAIREDEHAEVALDALQFGRESQRGSSGSGLSQRAWPLLDMMREASRQQSDIIWGV
jgi:hypothetical protein